MTEIKSARILIIAAEGFEQAELEVPRDRLRDAGAKVDVASPDGEKIRGWDKNDWGQDVKADLKISQARETDYDAIVIPEGVLNPDKLRIDEHAMTLVRSFLSNGKTVAAVCHGPWLLVQADALRGRKATSYKSIRTDLENAGAEWVDCEVVVDKGIVTSRNPGDLEAFSAKIVEEVREGRHSRRQAAE